MRLNETTFIGCTTVLATLVISFILSKVVSLVGGAVALGCGFVAGQFEPVESFFSVAVPGQQPCADDRHPFTLAVLVAAVEVIDDTDMLESLALVSDLAVVAQFDPTESRLRVIVPGQQPCLEDEHNAFEFVLALVVGVDITLC